MFDQLESVAGWRHVGFSVMRSGSGIARREEISSGIGKKTVDASLMMKTTDYYLDYQQIFEKTSKPQNSLFSFVIFSFLFRSVVGNPYSLLLLLLMMMMMMDRSVSFKIVVVMFY
mmetsp:Transcript_35019/g.84745  ORF Transcript_35019/g.84745 Transcript_35019/m.84745 type:complete len:115 (+) Transcript_35019:1946-2290(+)